MTERTLLIIRHAKSDWESGAPDHERPLNARGRREAPKLGKHLAAMGLRPDLVVCSDAARARQTWGLVAKAWPDPPPVRVDGRLYDASRSEVLDVIVGTPDEVTTLACVGHEPTSSALAAVLAVDAEPGVAEELAAGLKTARSVVLTFAGPWSSLEPGSAHLVSVIGPR